MLLKKHAQALILGIEPIERGLAPQQKGLLPGPDAAGTGAGTRGDGGMRPNQRCLNVNKTILGLALNSASRPTLQPAFNDAKLGHGHGTHGLEGIIHNPSCIYRDLIDKTR